jgi:hypothetical protein
MITYDSGLKELCIIAQDITVIRGLEACPLLEALWICETKVERITGIDHLTRLHSLHLYVL